MVRDKVLLKPVYSCPLPSEKIKGGAITFWEEGHLYSIMLAQLKSPFSESSFTTTCVLLIRSWVSFSDRYLN